MEAEKSKFTYLKEESSCTHCGEKCRSGEIVSGEHSFCCSGCRTVYDIINQNNLCAYYSISDKPGVTQKDEFKKGKFDFLENQQVQAKLISFQQGKESHVVFFLPQMHCSSCIWLLENLHQINQNITQSSVDFPKKEVRIVYDNSTIGLKDLALLLTSIGYEPHIHLADLEGKKQKSMDRQRILRIGVAGFCFGNIMMLSFPEYFGLERGDDSALISLFTYLSLFLALPVFFFSASPFFISSWKGIKSRFMNIDIPIALAIVITFGRSIFEIVSGVGSGYLDSMSGIVFFMLLGRYYQDKTYDSLSFERDYKSYFPVSVLVNANGKRTMVPLSELKIGDRMIIRSNEIIPADGLLFFGKGNIDYSFVSGEAIPVSKGIGEVVYAGGKQMGGELEIEVVKEVSQSYLTKLWNKEVFKKDQPEKWQSFVHALSQKFTFVLLSITAIAAIYWSLVDDTQVWKVVTSVLIVACPCALLLSATFTNGNMLRLLGRQGIYLRNALVLEGLSEVNHLVFDKTGTLTVNGQSDLHWTGVGLLPEQYAVIYFLARQSTHPLSRMLAEGIGQKFELNTYSFRFSEFSEFPGKGIQATIDGQAWKLGSSSWVGQQKIEEVQNTSRVFIRAGEKILGYFSFSNQFRKGLQQMSNELGKDFELSVISGDHEGERQNIIKQFGYEPKMEFKQSPEDKLAYIDQLQQQGEKVMMIGDGLNDAGALKQSNIGIAVSDEMNNFSPACDILMDAKKLILLPRLMKYAQKGRYVIFGSFVVSILYNIIGLYFSLTAQLSPVIAAILMPVSSISIVLFTTSLSYWLGYRTGLFSVQGSKIDALH
jgi:P-type Cu+ transporter